MPPIDPNDLLRAVSLSKRYRTVAPAIIARLSAEEIPKSHNLADAEKRTKRRLHQIFGAYHTPMPWDKLLKRLAAAKDDPANFRTACAEILKGHASTAERLPELDSFYHQIFAITGPPTSILDLACGLNPLTLPWMNLPANTQYTACDIDTEMARFLNGFFSLTNINGRADLNDLVAGPPTMQADVALILKTLPCLQHQSPNLGAILDRIQANWLIISFPPKSLASVSKGMSKTYRVMFEAIAATRPWKTTEVEFQSELVFIVQKPAYAG